MFGLTTKRKYNKLREKAEELFSFFPIAVCRVDNKGKVVQSNSIFDKLTGYEIGDVLPFPSDILSGEAKEKEFEMKTKERADIPVKVFSHKKDKDVVIGIMSLGEAKSVLKKLEEKTESKIEELKEMKEEILTIFKEAEKEKAEAKEERKKNISVIENLRSGLICIDNRKIVYVINPEAERITGAKKEEVIGKHIFKLNEFDAFKEIVPLLNETILQKREEEIKIGNRIFHFSFVPMEKKEGWSGTLVVFHDITREKAIEKAKTDFVTLAAHQLRTPSSAVKWSLRMLLDGDAGEISDSQKELADKAYRANDRMIGLISDLLDLDRIEDEKRLSRFSLVNFEETVKKVADNYREEIEKKELDLRILKEKEEIPKVMADPEGIKLVITNLLDNAVRYTPAKGEIKIVINTDKKNILFSIRDTGLGIPENQKSKIFSRFFRAGNILKIDTEGSGLGLYMAKKIIESHGGEMWFETKENKGTCFYFTLPVKKVFTEYITGEFY